MKTYEARFSIKHSEGCDLFYYRSENYSDVAKFVNRTKKAKNFKEQWGIERGKLLGNPCIFELAIKKIFNP